MHTRLDRDAVRLLTRTGLALAFQAAEVDALMGTDIYISGCEVDRDNDAHAPKYFSVSHGRVSPV
jgi:hypothetical protein